MSLTSDRSTLNRLNGDVASLRKQEAEQMRKEADANKRANAAANSASRASSTSLVSSYFRDADRESKKAVEAQNQRALISKKIADKTNEIARVQASISRAEEAEFRKRLAHDSERQRSYDQRIRDLENQLAERAEVTIVPVLRADETGKIHDFFISHASEDKEAFVDGLVAKARAAGLDVWYDRFELEWGDNLRQKIDRGLASAYFGVVVLSADFFKKPWPQYELDGLVQRDMLGSGRLLPIWHKVTVDEVAQHAPSLAVRLALNTAVNTTDEIVAELLKMRNKLRTADDAGGPVED
ncbi:toll/interleukin-1 receptor domain-containing protein [Sphingobium sp. Sx8-8]|uniref:toll/interleukin-1 receptor domain-containing protein n=1 Tax=Sphingobium sp. Sx8-8 TaxID=2933617 RepID=UPI001F598B97|nr:toll/interleukin-1 receptor domain-containing protein [Sphingobium sp. Sx8-8]